MGEPPCDVLELEMALELLEGELATELPAHMRAFARSHADGRTPPPAPLLARLASTLDVALNASRNELLCERGLAVLRLAVPLVIESDPKVAVIRAEAPSWPALQRLAAARDAVAYARFGRRAIELLHMLHGSDDVGAVAHDAPGPAIEGWHTRGPALEQAAIEDAWQLIATRIGVSGAVRVDRISARARTTDRMAPLRVETPVQRNPDTPLGAATPRTFVIEPKREVIVVVPQTIDTPAARFSVLHELGHAVVALGMTSGVPRAVDEAAASYVARFMEPPSWLPPRWPSELAAAARARRLSLAAMLDDIERRLPDLADVPGTTPPWALWHDPGSQAAYVVAEAMADRMTAELGRNPPRGQVLRALTAERDRIDHRTRL